MTGIWNPKKCQELYLFFKIYWRTEKSEVLDGAQMILSELPSLQNISIVQAFNLDITSSVIITP